MGQDKDSVMSEEKLCTQTKQKEDFFFCISHWRAGVQSLLGKQGLSTLNCCLGRGKP